MLNVYEAPPEQFTPQQEQQNLIPSLFSHSESPQKKFLSTTSTLLSMETPKKGKTFRNVCLFLNLFLNIFLVNRINLCR